MTAQIPAEHLRHDTLADMLVGDTRYAVRWAMAVDPDWNCWLNARHTCTTDAAGTSDMEVRRTSEGYVVVLKAGHTWQARPLPEIVGGADWVPVADVVSPYNQVASG